VRWARCALFAQASRPCRSLWRCVSSSFAATLDTCAHAELALTRLASTTRAAEIAEDTPQGRSEFQRPRRIIHSTRFAASNTRPVFVITKRSVSHRLNHSIEVAQIARSIARRLHLNEDLAERYLCARSRPHTFRPMRTGCTECCMKRMALRAQICIVACGRHAGRALCRVRWAESVF